ncbi:MAG: oligosaccharide flippase family protein [Nostoc sp. C3-bin3]|nr:oligosaccharide flippase family protein [Nostoc sp. C3-bin3]
MTALIKKIKSLSQFKLNTLANYAGRFWLNLLSFLLVPVYLHYLGVEAYGLIGAFYAVISFINLLDLGLSTTVSREVALRKGVSQKRETIPDLLRTTEIIYWTVGAAILLLMVLLADLIAIKWINVEKLDLVTVKWTVIILGLTVAVRWPITLYRSTLMALEKQVQVNILEVTLRTFRELGAVLVLVMVSPTIPAFLLWQVFIAIIEVFSMMMLAWHYQPKIGKQAHFQLQILQEIWRFAVGISWNMVVSLLLSQIDKIILSKLVSLEEFGYYILASTLSQRLSTIIEPFFISASPQLIALISKKDEEKYSHFFHKSSLFVSLVITPIAAAFIFFAPIILELWTQSSNVATKASSILAILTFGAMLNCMSHISYEILIAIGKPQTAAIFNTFSIFFIIPTMLLVVPHYQLFGTAIIRTILNILYYSVFSIVAIGYILPKERLQWLLQDTLVPIILCFTMCFAIAHLQMVFIGKQGAIFCMVIGLLINYGLLGCWYYYQQKIA